jgi:L-aspartate oxidase
MMWERVGIIRTGEGLSATLLELDEMENELRTQGWQNYIPQGREYLNQIRVARLITEAALTRTESLGAHHRTDNQPSSRLPVEV